MFLQKIGRFFRTVNYPSYFIFFVTKKCNMNCKMCFYAENLNKQNNEELTISEYDKISKCIKVLNILGISGGEPFLRDDLSEIIRVFYRNCEPIIIDLPTNGFFTDKIIWSIENIMPILKNTTLDLQLSLDGPEHIHDEIRGLKGSFKNVKETYNNLLPLRKKYRNLKIKICTVYSHYNQNCMLDFFDIIKRDFSEIDRLVLSIVHGSVGNLEAFDFDWNKYFPLCEYTDDYVILKNNRDLHSLFTRALRKEKNAFLKTVLEKHDMYKKCQAGEKVIVINEVGDVFPCEPLWSKVGNLRDNEYNLNDILKSSKMRNFRKEKNEGKCSCLWGLPMSNNILYSPRYYPALITNMVKMRLRS